MDKTQGFCKYTYLLKLLYNTDPICPICGGFHRNLCVIYVQCLLEISDKSKLSCILWVRQCFCKYALTIYIKMWDRSNLPHLWWIKPLSLSANILTYKIKYIRLFKILYRSKPPQMWWAKHKPQKLKNVQIDLICHIY